MRAGARIRVAAEWSSFRGMTGVVVESYPHLMVLLDGDLVRDREGRQRPMRFGEREIVPISDESGRHVGGAE